MNQFSMRELGSMSFSLGYKTNKRATQNIQKYYDIHMFQ